MPENRRILQDALVTTTGHPNDQYERVFRHNASLSFHRC